MKNKSVAVRQFDGTVELLKIDLINGEREIIPFNGIEKNRVGFGFFEVEKKENEIGIGIGKNELETVALIATPQGPVFFLKNLKYFPEIGKTKIIIKSDTKFFHCQILHEGHLIFGMFYEEKFGIGLHPFINSREDCDFYYWLSATVDNPEFYQKYTRRITYF